MPMHGAQQAHSHKDERNGGIHYLQLLGKHKLVCIGEVEFVAAGGVTGVEFKQLSQAAGHKLDCRCWQQCEELLLVFNVGDSREHANK